MYRFNFQPVDSVFFTLEFCLLFVVMLWFSIGIFPTLWAKKVKFYANENTNFPL